MTGKNKAPEPSAYDIKRAALADARSVYQASDGALTVAFYRRLCACGNVGRIAMNLMRAQKTSSRAKKYHGRGYRQASYETKNYSLGQLCLALMADDSGFSWGWGYDRNTPGYSWVLYVDLPGVGQCSFHSPEKGKGPDYKRGWDGCNGTSEPHILDFCDLVLKNHENALIPEESLKV